MTPRWSLALVPVILALLLLTSRRVLRGWLLVVLLLVLAQVWPVCLGLAWMLAIALAVGDVVAFIERHTPSSKWPGA